MVSELENTADPQQSFCNFTSKGEFNRELGFLPALPG